MKTIKLLFVFLLLLMPYVLRANVEIWKDENKFDLQLFNKNKDKNGCYSYESTDEKGSPLKITLVEDANYYTEFVEQLETPFLIEKKYYKNELSLAEKVHKFYSIKYDKSYFYDKMGNLIQVIDEYDNSNITILDLHEIMLTKFGVDIYKVSKDYNNNYIVQKSLNPTVYYIKKPINMTQRTKLLINGVRQDIYEIDGNTGDIISSPEIAFKKKRIRD